jgi:hypothetical protein
MFPSMKSFVFFVIAGSLVSAVDAFLVLSPSGRTAYCSSFRFNTAVNLLPSQAQELADCAHDLMKQAMEEKAKQNISLLSRDISNKLKMEQQNEECVIVDNEEICGPVSWARKRILGRFKQTSRSAGSSMAPKMP